MVSTYLPNHHLVILPAFYALLWHSLMPSPVPHLHEPGPCYTPWALLQDRCPHLSGKAWSKQVNTAIRVGVTKNSLWHVALHIFKIYGQSKIWVHFSDHNEAFGLRSLISQLFRLNLMKPNKLATLAKWCSTWNSIAVSPDFLQIWDQSTLRTRMTRMTSPSKALQFCCWTCAKCLEELHALLLTRRLEIQNALNLKLFKAPKASCWEKMGTWCYMHMPSTELFFEYKWLTPKILKHSFQRYLRKWWFKTSLDHVNICMYIKICISYIYIKRFWFVRASVTMHWLNSVSNKEFWEPCTI